MSTLLLRLAAPMQSWGIDSKFDIRKTAREPSKSGVIGLLAAALGRTREEPVDDLVKLRLGVRVDREGRMLRDFHMVKAEKTSYVTQRYYLEDAAFLVGLESQERQTLETLEFALKHPVFELYLGRKSCPPVLPMVLGIRETDLLTALRTEPVVIESYRGETVPERLRIVYDAAAGDFSAVRVHDVPVSFSRERRSYSWRMIQQEMVCRPGTHEHDPMEELR